MCRKWRGARQRFFTPGNLTALRELALRRTADRVDDQMADYLRLKAIEGPWNASERLMACVAPDAGRARRGAREPAPRASTPAGSPFISSGPADRRPQGRLRRSAMELAERLGSGDASGRWRRSRGRTLRLRVANVTQIVVGVPPRRTVMARMFRRSFSKSLIRRAGPFEVHLVQARRLRTRRGFTAPRIRRRPAIAWRSETGVATLAVACAVGMARR